MSFLKYLNYIENKFYIDSKQFLMLKALTSSDADNHEYFLQWLESVNFDEIDFNTFKFIPFLYLKFRNTHADHKYFPRMRGIYRYCLLRNNLVISDGKEITQKLAQSGIDMILFKGAALLILYYKNVALRYMADIDVLIKKEQMYASEKILTENTWRYRYPENKKDLFTHSYDYMNARAHGFDLHWHALPEMHQNNIDEGIWQRARNVEWDGINIKVMSPEDLFLTIVVNGFRDVNCRAFIPDRLDINWILDAAHIINGTQEFNWEIVYLEAEKRGIIETIFYALDILNQISKDLVSSETIQNFLNRHKNFESNFMSRLIHEGRTHSFNQEYREEIEANYFSQKPVESLEPLYSSNTFDLSKQLHNKYIKYFLDSNGQIEGLHLPVAFIPVVSEIFEIMNPELFQKSLHNLNHAKDVYLKFDAGVLKFKEKTLFPEYCAKIDILGGFLKRESGIFVLNIKVTNASKQHWFCGVKGKNPIGASYHLSNSSNEFIVRDTLPAFSIFFEPRQNYINFIIPGQEMFCQLPVIMPSKPGRYKIYVDLLHEGLTWFSQKGNLCQILDIEVK